MKSPFALMTASIQDLNQLDAHMRWSLSMLSITVTIDAFRESVVSHKKDIQTNSLDSHTYVFLCIQLFTSNTN